MPDSDSFLTTVTEYTTRDHCARLAHGTPVKQRTDRGRSYLSMPPGKVLVYCVFTRRPHTFVFRTVVNPSNFSKIMEIDRPVRLLIDTHTTGRHRKIQELFRYLCQHQLSAYSVPDPFYWKVGELLAGRLPKLRVLQGLLAQQSAEQSSP